MCVIVFGKLYYFQSQIGGSWVRDSTGGAHEPRSGRRSIDRTGRQWGFNYQLTGIGRGFEARAGFVPRNDVVTAHGFNRFTWYGAPGALMESFTVFFGPQATWDYGHFDAGHPIEGSTSANGMLRLRGGWNVTLVPTYAYVIARFDALFRVRRGARRGPHDAYTATGDAGRLDRPADGRDAGVSGIQRQSRRSSAARRRSSPRASLGTETTLTGSLSIRPSQRVRATGSLIVDRLTRDRTGAEFARTLIPRLELDYQPTRALFFRFVGEYRSQRLAALEDPGQRRHARGQRHADGRLGQRTPSGWTGSRHISRARERWRSSATARASTAVSTR